MLAFDLHYKHPIISLKKHLLKCFLYDNLEVPQIFLPLIESQEIGSAESPLLRGEKGVCKIDNLNFLHTPNPSQEGTLEENQHPLYSGKQY